MKQIRLFVLSLIISACANNEPQPLLLIATDATFAPFHLVNDAGLTTGFDVELARAMAIEDDGSIAKLRAQFSLDRDAGWPVRCDN